jgi:hypothetical protein
MTFFQAAPLWAATPPSPFGEAVCSRRIGRLTIRLDGLSHYRVDDLVLVRHVPGFFSGISDNGCQPAMARAQNRACALSLMPGNSRRSSTAADSSPPCS